ncbi:uncharacterized protein MYCFIDRAFT_177979, partial [Pseudocercospora fijiensis CIRAD86]
MRLSALLPRGPHMNLSPILARRLELYIVRKDVQEAGVLADFMTNIIDLDTSTLPSVNHLAGLNPHRSFLPLILQNHLHHIHINKLSRTLIHNFQQLIHLIITHLLTQIRENIPELSHNDET